MKAPEWIRSDEFFYGWMAGLAVGGFSTLLIVISVFNLVPR